MTNGNSKDMIDIKKQWKHYIAEALTSITPEEVGQERIPEDIIVTETPPRQELGDIAFPMFPYAKYLKRSPKDIAEQVEEQLVNSSTYAEMGTVERSGPYLNVFLNRPLYSSSVLSAIEQEGEHYGVSDSLQGRNVMIEFSCPNTNKPLHLGHLRNDAIGESMGRIFTQCNARVMKVNLINDRGIHICKSMLAYQKFGNGQTPQSRGLKGDHFVGDFYVKFNQWSREDAKAEEKAREMLRQWEQGDPEVNRLWKQMNRWAIEGIEETYQRTGVSFDKIYYESQTYERGREEVLRGLERGVFTRDEEGTVWADLSSIGLDRKVLLRGDGTTLYLTQDIGTALIRREDWPFNSLIYVVGSEQKYHFQVLFHILEQLGYEWATHLYHLAYGMVNLPEGKMKSREGTVVDADDLLDELKEYARQEIIDKGREDVVDDIEATSERIGLGALNYYLLQVSPSKDMIFDPRESISFNGNTGPYLQYTCARISTMLKKYQDRIDAFRGGTFRPELLTVEDEWKMIKLLGSFAEYVESGAEQLNPAVLCSYLYEVAKTFSHYYHENPVLHNDDPDLVVTRVTLVRAVRQVMKNGFRLVGIPFLEVM
jgi:arginyl-tRNA synthetase